MGRLYEPSIEFKLMVSRTYDGMGRLALCKNSVKCWIE